MIVLNGQPFIKYNLRSIYPYAHQIIVVEGASNTSVTNVTPAGHSMDGTLEALYEFKEQEDPDNKIIIVTAEDEGYPNGFWPGEKDEQSQTYARRATGNYLWQIDADEFYHEADIQSIITLLTNFPEISAVTFPMLTYWGSPWIITDGWYLRRGAASFHRLFQWGKGYTYASHRPPTILDETGKDTREKVWLKSNELRKLGIFLNHYSLLFPRHVKEKCEYYERSEWSRRVGSIDWYNKNFIQLNDPIHTHNVFRYPAWLEETQYEIPEQITKMWENNLLAKNSEPIRSMDDVEQLLHRPSYKVLTFIMKILDYPNRLFVFTKNIAIHWRDHIRNQDG